MRHFKEGELIATEAGSQCKVKRFSPKKMLLGEGGQGAVYLVEYMGRDYALKWYKPGFIKNEKAFRDNLTANINAGPPRIQDGVTPSKKFVWPKFLTESKDGSFGYLMDVYPSDYTPFTKILLAEAKFSGLEATLNAALNIINAFRDLHREGKSYQDINDGGFVIRLSDGDVLICDCDNVAPDGENLGIVGKPGYMAPEIVASRRKTKPSMRTDSYSLANILFRLLMRGDPLAGARDSAKVVLTEQAEVELYGENPIFVFDPDNDSNRPVRGVHNNLLRAWPTYPEYVKQAFIDAFTKGAKSPDKRMTENGWQKLFVQLKGELIQCMGCKTRGFAGIFKNTGNALVCPACKHAHILPKVVSINSFPVHLFPGVKLLKGHTDCRDSSLNSEDYLTQTGVIVQNPKDPDRWGIFNTSNSVWRVKEPGANSPRELDGAKPVAITEGLEVTFPNGEKVKV